MNEEATTGVEDPAAEGNKETSKTEGDVKDNDSVPRSVVESVRKDFQEKIKAIEDELEIYKSNRPVNNQAQPPQETKDPFAELMPDDDDIVSGKQFKEAMMLMTGRIGSALQALQYTTKTKDYDKVVGEVFEKNLKKNRPDLYNAVMRVQPELRPVFAYELSKNDPEYLKTVAKDGESEEAKRIIENLNKPGALETVTGKEGAVSAGDKWKTMSSKDFKDHVARIKQSNG